jgi:hypothetical protein
LKNAGIVEHVLVPGTNVGADVKTLELWSTSLLWAPRRRRGQP